MVYRAIEIAVQSLFLLLFCDKITMNTFVNFEYELFFATPNRLIKLDSLSQFDHTPVANFTAIKIPARSFLIVHKVD